MVQRQIGSDRNLDDWLAERHRRPGQTPVNWQSRVMKGYPAEPDGSKKKVRSWVLVLPEVEIDCQELIPGLSSHGIIDYVFAIVAAEEGPFVFFWSRVYLKICACCSCAPTSSFI